MAISNNLIDGMYHQNFLDNMYYFARACHGPLTPKQADDWEFMLNCEAELYDEAMYNGTDFVVDWGSVLVCPSECR